ARPPRPAAVTPHRGPRRRAAPPGAAAPATGTLQGPAVAPRPLASGQVAPLELVVALDGPRQPLADHPLVLVRVDAGAGALEVDVVEGEHVPLGQGAADHDAPAEALALLHLRLAHRADAAAEGLVHEPRLLDEAPHLLRVGRDPVVPALHVLVDGEVLLDHARPQRHGRERHGHAERV